MNLFVIGNGFDCYLHMLPTRYSDFRNYLCDRFDIDVNDNVMHPVPEVFEEKDGGDIYNERDIAGFIVSILTECGGNDWNDLERYLGSDVFYFFQWEVPKYEDENGDDYSVIETQSQIAKIINNTFSKLKEYFYDWVSKELINIPQRCFYNNDVKKVFGDIRNDKFLTFNYTTVLEKVYHVNDICHIHGKAGDDSDDIYFGHGNSSGLDLSYSYVGTEYEFEQLRNCMYKDTWEAYDKHIDFFDSLNNVEAIYSYGFSFSDVDLTYINRISDRTSYSAAAKGKKIPWYLNNFDWNNEKIKALLDEYGFEVRHECRW